MTTQQFDRLRDRLMQLDARLRDTTRSLEETARKPAADTAGEAAVHAPRHPGDASSEVYDQELNATLLENEEFLRGEVHDSLNRIANGTYGRCEHCHKAIPHARLEAIPYARYCTPCAEKEQQGRTPHLHEGRFG